MKGNSDITATAISDAALICVYLTMTLFKAALKCPPALLPQWARRVSYVCGCGKNYSRVMKGIMPNSRNCCHGGQAAFFAFVDAEKSILAL